MEENINVNEQDEYSSHYSEKSLFEKIKEVAKKAGINVIYAGLLLYYTLQKPGIPVWVKATIISALGYFISPIDAIPDFIIGGFADDFGAIALALGTIAIYIDEDVKRKAKEKLKDWFGEYDEELLKDIEKRINK